MRPPASEFENRTHSVKKIGPINTPTFSTKSTRTDRLLRDFRAVQSVKYPTGSPGFRRCRAALDHHSAAQVRFAERPRRGLPSGQAADR